MHLLSIASSRSIFDSLDITDATKQDYFARLPYFLGFVRQHGITHNLLLDYKNHLRSRVDLGVASKNKYLAVARLTLRELHRQGTISVDLSTGVKSFQQNTKHKVQGLKEDEVETVCNYLRNASDSFKTARLRALLSLLLFQGLRQIEICRLDVADVDLANNTIKILGKGREDKEHIHLHPETNKALGAYLKRSHVKSGPLFTSLNGQSNARRLSTRGLRMIIKDLFRQLGIERTVHGTRHYFTTQLIKHFKSDLATVARYTRHNSLETLTIYNDQILNAESAVIFSSAFSDKIG